VDFFQDTLNHPAYDSYWKELSTREQLEHLHVPVFSVGGWYDSFVQSDLEAFTILSRRRPAITFSSGLGRTTCRSNSRPSISETIPALPFAATNWNGSITG